MAFDELYQQVILDHSRHPRNKEDLDFISDDLIFENPACGDSIKVAVDLDEKSTIIRIRFDGDGCAINTSSASMMTEFLTGKTVLDALHVTQTFIQIMTNESDATLESWGDLKALEEVRKFPQRIKCATLPWNAVKYSLEELIKSQKTLS